MSIVWVDLQDYESTHKFLEIARFHSKSVWVDSQNLFEFGESIDHKFRDLQVFTSIKMLNLC